MQLTRAAPDVLLPEISCMVSASDFLRTTAMSLQDSTIREGAIEECLDEINEFVGTLDHYSPATVAVAMSVHLHTVLCAMVECDLCTAEQVRNFVQELERDVCAEIRDEDQREEHEGDLTHPEPLV
jgi:hypothetical protein